MDRLLEEEAGRSQFTYVVMSMRKGSSGMSQVRCVYHTFPEVQTKQASNTNILRCRGRTGRHPGIKRKVDIYLIVAFWGWQLATCKYNDTRYNGKTVKSPVGSARLEMIEAWLYIFQDRGHRQMTGNGPSRTRAQRILRGGGGAQKRGHDHGPWHFGASTVVGPFYSVTCLRSNLCSSCWNLRTTKQKQSPLLWCLTRPPAHPLRCVIPSTSVVQGSRQRVTGAAAGLDIPLLPSPRRLSQRHYLVRISPSKRFYLLSHWG